MMKMMRIKRQDFALISSLLLILLQPCIGHLKQDKILDKPSSQDVEHGFGAAKHFMPLPNTVVGSHCTWQLRLNTVPARIPETITEVLCHSPGEKCGGSDFYTCKQMKAKMLVSHTESVLVDDHYDWMVRSVRNVTINIGCGCVYMEPVLNLFFPGPREKKNFVSIKH